MARKGKEWLTAPEVKAAKSPGRLADGGGLYLAITERTDEIGAKVLRRSWTFLYSINGARREMGLGSAESVSLKQARDGAEAARKLLAARIDPLEDRQDKRAAAAQAEARRLTFKQAASQYIAAHKAGWKNPKHAKLWEASLKQHASGLDALAVSAITVEDVLRTIEDLWKTKPETASRVRGRIEAILSWCAVRGYRDRNTLNPAAWRGNLEKALPKRSKVRKVKHHAALAYKGMGAFMADLRQLGGVGALALEFAILTAGRTGEVLGAQWSELDLREKLWTIPAERMKMDRPHRVPLSKQAMAVLERAKSLGNKKWVFPGLGTGSHLSNMAMLQVLKRMGQKGKLTSHGFRSSFRDWCSEETGFPREIAEAALAHAIGDRAEAVYRRGDALSKRCRLMQAWADYCDRPVVLGAVVNIASKRKRAGE